MQRLVLMALALGCYGSYTWAAVAFFHADDAGARYGKRLIFGVAGLATAASLLSLAFTPPGSLTGFLGVMLFGASLSLFWWTIHTVRRHRFAFAFAESPPSELVTAGPYRWVRHPFYAAYILGWMAPAVAAPGLVTLAVVLCMTALYVRAAALEETAIGRSPLAETYRAYAEQAGLMWPRISAPFGARSVSRDRHPQRNLD